ncbi:hypothetical protein GCM10009677_27950 [Sphaerisporangium rubeum]|uniref:Uncharacterized protein n=1 Tax=Sphaerisporangium rubeum TaxID=321317 RepID=A0A7X0M664_9ACTN|nr:hypothetical protein [Sphaerisporangium rubeum]MBB6472907.1 hypothetical protein [Sphaerisporangium rubeum]
MNDLSGEVRRLCVALDTEDPGGATPVTRDHAHRRLVDLVTEAVARAGLDRLYLADRGATSGTHDQRGAFYLLPSGVNEARIVAGLTGELRLALRRRNHGLGPGSSLRLRVRAAFHQGPTRVADTGFFGRAVDTVHHLRDTPEVRTELHRHPHADLAVVLSAQLFEDVIGCDHRDLRRSLFRRLLVPSADGVGEAWLSLPGADTPSQTRPYRGATATPAYAPTPPAGH